MAWKKIYKSKHTGAEIDAAVDKAAELNPVTANPTLAGTEAALTGLQVGSTKYKVGGGGLSVVGFLYLTNKEVSNFSGRTMFAQTPGSGQKGVYEDWYNPSLITVASPIAFDYAVCIGVVNSKPEQVVVNKIFVQDKNNIEFEISTYDGTPSFNLSDDVQVRFLLLKS